jgi:NADP-dependent 3-hydroxy acid dehydrogenase YdfG
MKIKNKVIVVTLAGNSMVREMVLNVLNKGAKVAAIDLNETFLKEKVQFAKERNTDLSIHVLNITDKEAIENIPEQILKIHGQKAAVKLITEGLTAELMNTKVNVSVVFPGAVGTNIDQNSGISTLSTESVDSKGQEIKMLAPREVAEIIVSGLEKNKVRIYVSKDSKMMSLL